jgi:hypothetical protein
MVLITVLQEELEEGPPVETVLTIPGTVLAKVVPRARAVRQVIAVPGQAYPLQVVMVDRATTPMEELEVPVGQMEADLVVPVMILIP